MAINLRKEAIKVKKSLTSTDFYSEGITMSSTVSPMVIYEVTRPYLNLLQFRFIVYQLILVIYLKKKNTLPVAQVEWRKSLYKRNITKELLPS